MYKVLDEISNLLQTHPNRDKVVSLIQYTLKLWGSTSNNKALMTASARFTAARACLRMFDSPAAIKTALNYGLGEKEGPIWGSVGSAACLMTLGYLHAEKLLFLLDTGLIKLTPEDEQKARIAHKLFWSLSSSIGLLKSLKILYAISQEMKLRSRRKCTPERFIQASLVTAKSVLDVLHSVSWLPQGWLWGGRLSVTQASAAATGSAVLGLIIHYNAKRLG